MATSRSTTIGITVLLLLVFAGGLFLSSRILTGRGVPLLQGGRVAVLPISGVITSEESFLHNLSAFRRNSTVRAFVIEIRSPGGGVGASQAIYRELRKLRETDERPVIAWMGDVGASGGYYVALAADSIYALPGTITGSIGVVMEFPNAQELLRKVGIGWEVVKSGEHKDMGSPARPLTPSDREILEGLVGDVYDQFVDAVAANRTLDRSRVLELADGRVFTGEQAVELGLVDGISTLEEAIELAGRMAGLGDHPSTLRPREPRFRLVDLLLGLSGRQVRRLAEWIPAVGPRAPRLLYEWR
ncbi:MAG: signal peptide peptidase SppA [Gemmatimonadota bacterium]